MLGGIDEKIRKVESEYMGKVKSSDFRIGDTVKVHYKMIEGDKERIQVLQGVVIRKHNNGMGSTFTIRKVSYGVGVECTFPLYSPRIQKIEVVKRGKVRRAKLYYLRERTGKSARLKEIIGKREEEAKKRESEN